jgi:hypothetical protein
MTGNGKGGCRDTSARAACRPVGYHVWIQEATNNGRREDKARPKDNDVKETLDDEVAGTGSLLWSCKASTRNNATSCGGKEEGRAEMRLERREGRVHSACSCKLFYLETHCKNMVGCLS